MWGPDRVATYRCSSVSHMFSVGRKASANYIETRRWSTFQIDVGVGRETLVAKVRSTRPDHHWYGTEYRPRANRELSDGVSV